MNAPNDSGTTEDLFLGGSLRLRQPVSGYRAGLDAVLLAAACPASSGHAARCLDCGAGVGTVGLAAARRVHDLRVTMVERDATLAGLAARNIEINGLADRCRVVQGDLTGPLTRLGALAAEAGTYDYVVVNPPYHAHGGGTRASDALKDASHAMAAGQLEAWVRFAAAMTRVGGTFTLVHRPAALPEVLAALARRFGRTVILPLHPRVGEPASRLLVQSVKGSRADLQILAGRFLHQQDGHGFVPEFDAILRAGAPLRLGD